MSKLKLIVIAFLTLSLGGCQLVSANYFTSAETGKFIGIAVNYSKFGEHSENGKTLVVYVIGNDYNLEPAKEAHIISSHVNVGDDETTINAEVNIYANASNGNNTFSLSAIYEREGEIVYEKVSPISAFEPGQIESMTYNQEIDNTVSNQKVSLNITVNFGSEFVDEVLTIYEFDNNHQLKKTTVIESLNEIAPQYEYYILETVKADGSVHRQLSSNEISVFKEGDDLLIYDFINVD